MKTLLKATVSALVLLTAAPSHADEAAAKKWASEEFQPSTLTTHEYEAKVLAKAFFEITGIRVNHDLIGTHYR